MIHVRERTGVDGLSGENRNGCQLLWTEWVQDRGNKTSCSVDTLRLPVQKELRIGDEKRRVVKGSLLFSWSLPWQMPRGFS